MKSKNKKRLLALVLCMVVALSNSSFIFASETGEAVTIQEAEIQTDDEMDTQDTAVTPQAEEVQPISEEQTVTQEPAEETPVDETVENTEVEKDQPSGDAEQIQDTESGETAATEESSENITETEEQQDTVVEDETQQEETKVSEAAELKYEYKDADGNITETITADLPEGAFRADISEITMEVEKADESTQNDMSQRIEKKLPQEKRLGSSAFYKIIFKVNGEITDPEKMVTVTFKGHDLKLRESDEIHVCYLKKVEEEQDEVEDIISKENLEEELKNEGKSTEDLSEYLYSEIAFKEDGKTTDGIMLRGTASTIYGYYIEEKVPTLTYEDENVVIKVSAVKEGAIPEGTSLQVTPIEKNSEAYAEVEKHLTDSVEDKTCSVAGFFAYDISLIDPDNQEIEPDGNVKVTMDYKKEILPAEVSEDASSLEVTVVHLEENADGTKKQVVDMVADEKEEASVETNAQAKVSKAEFITDSFSEYAIAWYANTSEKLTTVATEDHTSAGITMRMIDMEGYTNDNYSIKKSGRNTDRFYFPGGGYGSGNIKKGLLNAILADNGYPTTTNRSGSQNLEGLFGGGTTVNHLFRSDIYQSTGYYEYSSFENYAYLGTNTDFTVYGQIGTPEKNNTSYFYRRGNFMPYNSITASDIANYRERYDENGNDLGKDGRLLHKTQGTNNYFFGMYMGANFLQPRAGKVKAGSGSTQTNPMIYEFNGDDDLWIYIDSVLVLDIGGVHDAHSGYINFATGEVGWYDCQTGKTPVLSTSTIKAIFQKAGVFPDGSKWSNSKADNYFRGNTFKDYTTHSFKMFYMERGAGASNLHMKFNLQVIPEGQIEVRKELSNTDKEKYSNVNFAFQVYAQKIKTTDSKGNETYYEDQYELLDSATDKNTKKAISFNDVTLDGKTYKSVFYLKPDQSAIFSGLKANRKYYVVEIGVNAQEYDKIVINGVEYKAFDENAQITGTIADVKTDEKTVEARPVVVCTNNCSAYNSRELRITKQMKEGQTTADTFAFQVQLSNDEENATLIPYANGDYYLKDAEGNYYYYSKNVLKSNGTEAVVCGKTDASGIIKGVPVGYTAVLTQILSGTSFRVDEVQLDEENYLEPEKTVKEGTFGTTTVKDADGAILLGTNAEITVTNSKPVNTLRIKKTDAEKQNAVLKGASFKIQKQKNGVYEEILKDGKVWTVTTDENGEAVFGNLENGIYRVIETKAPEGYVMDTESNTFTIELPYKITDPADSSIQVKEESERGGKYLEVTKTVTNQKKTWEIVKVSSSSRQLHLKDAEFELSAEKDRSIIYYGKSDATGIILWYSDAARKDQIREDQITEGVYVLRETRAPQGYTVSTTNWKLELGQNGSWIRSENIGAKNLTETDHKVTCYFENDVIYNLPSTGSTGIFTMIFGGILLMIAGVLIIFKMKQKEKLK